MQVLSLTILFMGVLLYIVPTHMKNLITYILSSKHLAIEKIAQEQILLQLSENILTDLGRVFLGVSSVLLVPSTLGYVGAVRESKVLLIMYLTPLILMLVVEVLFFMGHCVLLNRRSLMALRVIRRKILYSLLYLYVWLGTYIS